MEKTGTYFNYTFCNTTQLGRYIVNGFGDIGGTVTVWSYDFLITSSGTELQTSDSILSILFFFGILIIAVIFFGLALVFNNRKTIFVSIFFLSMGIMIIIVDFVYIMNIMDRFQESMGYASSIFNNLYYLLTILLIVGSMAIIIFLIVYAMTKLKEVRYGDSVK
jgi:predicted membrane channel-forming protein YqfA (hemolysin III family)